MKKKLFLVTILSVFFAMTAIAGAATIDGFIASESRHFEAPFTWGDQYFMMASAYTDVNTFDVYLQNVPNSAGDVPLIYASGWSGFTGAYPYLYVSGLGGYASPGSIWEERTYTFYIDSDGTPGLSGTDPTATWSLPSGSVNQMGLPSTVTVTGGIHPTITWAKVTNADWYRVRLFPVVQDGPNYYPNRGLPLDESDRILYDPDPEVTEYSFEYTGDAFETYGTLAIAVETYNYAGGQAGPIWYNRSVYNLEHNPVPIPGAVWLLGSGLVGLAGFRRKLKK